MNSVLQILNKNQLLSCTNVQKKQFFSFSKRPEAQAESISRQKYSVQGSLSIPKQKIETAKGQFESLPFGVEISQTLGENQKMPEYKGFHKVFSEEQTDLIHKEGQVLLVDVWATWCGPCQNPMKHNQEMLEKNQEKWKGKVRIVAVSVDQQKQVISNRINSKGWTKIEHLTLLGWDGNHPLIQNFQIQGIPFVFLVDKQGFINYTGHPSQIILEDRINQLLARQDVKSEVEASKKNESSSQEIEKELKKIESLSKIFNKKLLEQKFGKAELFVAQVRDEIKIGNGKLNECKVTIKVSTFENTPELIQSFKDLLKDIDPTIYQIQENLVKFVNVPEVQNPQCADCKSKLTSPYYWCKWDPNPNSFRCRQCIQRKPEEQGKHYSYLQNSVFLPGAWKKIATKSLGNNVQPESIEKVEAPNQFGCNGCGTCPEDIGVARYICLACRADPNPRGDYIDICQQCFSAFFKGDQQKIKQLSQQGHTDKHPLLRVLYNVEGYYTF